MSKQACVSDKIIRKSKEINLPVNEINGVINNFMASVLGLESFPVTKNGMDKNKQEILGKHVYDELRGFDAFIGFFSDRFFACYIGPERYLGTELIVELSNSCVNLIKSIVRHNDVL